VRAPPPTADEAAALAATWTRTQQPAHVMEQVPTRVRAPRRDYNIVSNLNAAVHERSPFAPPPATGPL
jgi:hypothetical protein